MEKVEAGIAMCELVSAMVKGIVDQPGEVKVTADVRGVERVTLDVIVAAGDVGKVIGKEGRTARAMRTILGAMSMTCGVPSYLNILEGNGNGDES